LKKGVADSARGSARPAPSAVRSPPIDTAAAELSEGSVLDLILNADASGVRPVIAPRDDLSKFVANAVQDHVVKPPSVDQQTLIDQIDGVISATMRVVLHHRDFQSIEALWRGLAFLAKHLDTDENLQLYVADVTRSELNAAVLAPEEAAGRGLLGMLRGAGPGAHGAWTLIVGAYNFEPSDLAVLSAVGGAARTAGVPWISAADARFAGIDTFHNNADPDDWDSAPLAGWEEFRRSAAAHWVGLTLPRFLLRVPYGAKTDECTALDFEETEDGALPHDHYLWGNSALLVARLHGEAAADGDDPPTHGTLTGLPLFVAKVDGLPEILPVAEAFLGGRALTHLLDSGLTVIASERDGDSVRIPRVQSCALPAAPLATAIASEDQ
jgi:type VI secretion system protein ImpC